MANYEDLAVPKYELYVHKKSLTQVYLGRSAVRNIGLAMMVAITPTFDQPEGFFNAAQAKNRTEVMPLNKTDEDKRVEGYNKALLFRIMSPNVDSDSLRRLFDTAEDMESIANAWHDPQKSFNIFYHTLR